LIGQEIVLRSIWHSMVVLCRLGLLSSL